MVQNIKAKKFYPSAIIPTYSREGDAGLDLHAAKETIILANQRVNIGTGIGLEIPANHVGLIWDRSGLAVHKGLHVIAGVVDSNYRGEICVTLFNSSSEKYRVEADERIGQLLIQSVAQVRLKEVNNLSDSVRGKKGFGSSGKQ